MDNLKIRKWQKKNQKRVTRMSYKWAKKNPKKVMESARKWNKNNPEKRREMFRSWSKRNKKKRQLYQKSWQKKNKDKRKIYVKRQINRVKNNIKLRLRDRVRITINKKLKKRLFSKEGRSIRTFLPYTIDELKQHLENQFEPWMNWDNWGIGKGKWNIDHIRPDSLFDYKSVEDKEFQECWALKNLRPLDAIKNIKKSNKII